MRKQRFAILSIEDNEPDFALLEEALSTVPGVSLDLVNIQNGKLALDFLYRQGDFQSAPKPDLIILDINLPNINGHDILKIIKNDYNLRLIPVIMFSTSDSEKDIEESYRLYANSYITKTFELKELFKKIATMAEYWLKTTELPSTPNFCLVHKTVGGEANTESEEKK